MIGTKQYDAMTAFYEKVFGKAPDMVDQENGFAGWQVGNSYIGVLKHSEMGGSTKDPWRLMLNYETDQVQEEFERIKKIGGAVICFLTFKMSPPWGKINFENEPTWTLESPVKQGRRRGDEKGGRLRTDTQSVSH